MSEIFPEPVFNLPEADIPIEGLKAYIAQGEHFQILYMEFEKDVIIKEHSHESQWGSFLKVKLI